MLKIEVDKKLLKTWMLGLLVNDFKISLTDKEKCQIADGVTNQIMEFCEAHELFNKDMK
jgi:hypothetical protein